MAKPLFLLQSHKFSTDNIETTLVCPICDEAFKKEFPIDLEGQITEFKCPVCDRSGEADLPYRANEERELMDEDLEVGEENLEDLDEIY